jgi:hypothetical protein
LANKIIPLPFVERKDMSYYSYSRNSWRNRSSAPWVIGALIVVVLLIVSIPMYTSYKRESVVQTTVCSKEAVPTGNSGHEYRVYTTTDTYVVKDHVVNGTSFRASNTYGRIQPNKVYKLTVYGWRIPFFSSFKNITKAEVVPDATPASCD